MQSFARRRTRTLGWTLAVAAAAACGAPAERSFFELPAAAGRPSAGAGGASGAESGGSAGASAGFAGSGGASAGTAATGGAGGAGGMSGMAGSAAAGAGASGGALGGTSGDAGEGPGGAPPVDCSAYGLGAEDFDGHCYLFRPGAVRFEQAVDDCADRGAHLVTISSEGRSRAEFEAENSFVWQLAGQVPVWIAATDGKGPLEPGDGTFYTWLTGEPMTFDAWSGGQPNNSATSCSENTSCSCDQGACYEHCGFMWATEGVDPTVVPGWNDRLCEHEVAFVCEWDGV